MRWSFWLVLTLALAVPLVGIALPVAAQAAQGDPESQALQQLLNRPPQERAALVIVGQVEGVDWDEYQHEDFIYRLYTITLKITKVVKGESAKVGESLRFTARHIHAHQIGLLEGGNSLPVYIPTDEVFWVPQVKDTVQVCLDPSIAYHAVQGRSITPEPAPAGGPPTTAVGEKRVLRVGDWLIVAVAVGLAMFMAGIVVGRRWSPRRAGIPASSRAEPGAAADRPRDGRFPSL